MGAQTKAVEIRKHAPRPTGSSKSADAAICTLLPDNLRDALRKAEKAAYAAWQACEANLSPDTDHDVRERGYTKLQQAEAAHVKATDAALSWLQSNTEKILTDDAESTNAEVDEVSGLLNRVEDILTDHAKRKLAISRLRDRNELRRWKPLGGLNRLKLPGGESLHNLRVGVESLSIDLRPVTYLSPEQYRDQRDAGTLPERFKIAHSPGGLQGGIPS